MNDTDRLTESDNLAVRLAKLECQNQSLSRQVKRMRIMVFATVVLGLIAVSWVVVPSSSALAQTRRGAGATRRDPETIRASSFVVVDREGVPRGSLGYNEQEQATVLNLEPFKNGRINLADWSRKLCPTDDSRGQERH